MTSHMDTLLDKEDLTLQEVLDEEEVLQECKTQNKRLIDFLTTDANIEELVNYITQEPLDETDEKLRYKYPNIACELLTSDVNPITDKLAGDVALMNKVYSFIENDAPLNPLLASFYSKVMGLLISRRSEKMLEFLQSKDDFIGHLLRHMGTSAIMDLLLRLITCIENPECHMMCLSWLNENQLIQKLVAMIDPSHSEEKHSNACQTLCDIIRLSREHLSQLQEKVEPDPLLAATESEETITDLLNHMLDGEKVASVLVNGTIVIQNLLEFKRLSPDGGIEAMSSICTEHLRTSICNTVSALIPRLKDFHQLLKDPPKQYYSPMITTVGTLNPPFGNTRLQITRLITLLLFTRMHKINVELANLGTLGLLIELAFKYTWNNLLHTQVEQCLAIVLQDESSEEEDEEHKENPLHSQLFTEHKLFEKILEIWEDNDQHQTRPGGHRQGYMGHATKIANHIIESMEKGQNSEKIKGYFEALPTDVKEQWSTFVSGSLSEINKQNTMVLVSMGGQSMYSSSEEEDPDFRDIAFPQDTAMHQFGFNEEDFGESEEWDSERFKERISSINFDINPDETTNTNTLFDQVCNEKICQFDDQDSEEDLWEDKEITFSQSSGSRQNSTLGTTPGQTTAPTAGTTDSDSSDSDEELDSPLKIHQTPTSSSPQRITADSTTEKMDVDNSEGWANFDDISMETTPALAVTDPGPAIWQGEKESETAMSDNWAKFNSESSVAATIKVTSTNTDTPLADFTSLDKSGNDNSDTQRSKSPIAMDTNESSNPRVAAYLVSSAPADLATNIAESTTVSNLENVSKQSSEDKQDKLSSSAISSDNLISSNAVTTTDISSTDASPGVTTQSDSFLASAGLMKCSAEPDSSQANSKAQADTTSIPVNTAADQKELERIRSQAKEALDQFNAATSTVPNPSQNGPV